MWKIEILLKHAGIQRALFANEEKAKEEANKLKEHIGFPSFRENYEEHRIYTMQHDAGEIHIECESVASVSVVNIDEWDGLIKDNMGEANHQAKIEVAKKKALKEAGLE